MKPRDTLQRFVFEHAAIRGEIVHLDSAWRAVLERHDYPPAVRNLLGELMAAAVLLSAMLKFNGSMILQIQGNGPVNLLVVESTSERTLRGMAQWNGELASMPFAELVGQGKFVITIDPKEEGQRYQGIVSIEGETVSEALENYLARSEQIDSRLWLAADTEQAAGMLLQKMPAGHDEDVDMWQRTSHLGATITRDELLELPARDILHRLARACRERAAHARLRRGPLHHQRTRRGGCRLRVLQSTLPLRQRRRGAGLCRHCTRSDFPNPSLMRLPAWIPTPQPTLPCPTSFTGFHRNGN
jgi:molecular chaperone Hsp33